MLKLEIITFYMLSTVISEEFWKLMKGFGPLIKSMYCNLLAEFLHDLFFYIALAKNTLKATDH